jgi:hypothetical protein
MLNSRDRKSRQRRDSGRSTVGRGWSGREDSMRKPTYVLIACLVLAGCGDTIKGKSVAEPQVAVFHEQLNARQFEEIYSAADDGFRRAAPKEKVLQLFAAIERKLGKVRSSATVNWNVKTFNFATTVVLVAETKFEKGTGTETFTFHVSGDKAALIGYNINSLDMMIQ